MAKLPTSMTTVTRLSKIIAMVLFITLPFIGFYLGMLYQKMVTPAYPPTVYEAPQKANPIESSGGDKCGGVGGIQCSAGYICQPEGEDPASAGICVPDKSLDPSRQPQRPDLPVSSAPGPATNPNEPVTMCTMDAKQCSDGSWVGRTGPNCEFVCPR